MRSPFFRIIFTIASLREGPRDAIFAQRIDCIVSGTISSIAGRVWVAKWRKLDGISTFPDCAPSNRMFRFGTQMARRSCGIVHLNDNVNAALRNGARNGMDLTSTMDVVELDVPFLLPRKPLAPLKGEIDFCANTPVPK